ncbi:uncharacterized protein LOC143007702 isoform X2 [Genypterus blacodes]|uniref:uncharacterized protein LOC143007702 isoform X2 n=1 Tax=Genypterus blacodes TaxID=154954 RepID=UPI003F76B3FF
MACDFRLKNAPRFGKAETFCRSEPWLNGDRERVAGMEPVGSFKGRGPMMCSSNFEVIDGLMYRKKLEKGFINYREVLDADRRREAVSTFHHRRPGLHHHSLEETYKCVAENYWWEGMYFQIRDYVRGCPECQSQHRITEPGGRGCVSKTIASHGADVLRKLRSQREAGQFCDITLRTNGQSYSAHRAVLAAVSDHFQEIFTEMDSNGKADVDLTGFSEENLLSLLDFSYSSTMCVRQEDLPEVITLARHLGMWPAVEACTALLKEQKECSCCPRMESPDRGFTSASAGPYHELHRHQKERKRKRVSEEDSLNERFSMRLESPDRFSDDSPRRSLRRTPTRQPQDLGGIPLSPTHRMKLMDFKSPSPKKAIALLSSPTRPPSSPRLLRSSPGAAQQVEMLLPRPESPRRNRKSPSIPPVSSTSRTMVDTVCSPVRIKQEVVDVADDEEDYERAQEKYKLMNVLGLQRTALLPRPEDLIGWRQKKRLRKLKANNYSLTKRRKPRPSSPGLAFGDLTLALPLCDPVNTYLLNQQAKTKPAGQLGKAVLVTAKKTRPAPLRVPPCDRSMRSQGPLPDMFRPASRATRRSPRKGTDSGRLPVQLPPRRCTKSLVRNTVRVKDEPADFSISGPLPHHTPLPSLSHGRSKVTARTPRYNNTRSQTKSKLKQGVEKAKKAESHGLKDVRHTVKDKEPAEVQISDHAPPPSIYNHPLYKVIKEEPADPVPVAEQFPDPPASDLGKRQSKPPNKLLDSGFLFSFCRPAGVPVVGVKKEEESVDICLTRSVSQVGEQFGPEEPRHRALRTRGVAAPPPVKRERKERSVSQSRVQKPRTSSRILAKPTASKTTQAAPKQQGKLIPVSSRSCVLLESIRRARLKQLRGPRSQAPTKDPKTAHTCLQCNTSYRDCDALITHRLRHIEGKHWPCPLCSKTFFRLRNVRNHIRTHDQKLYKCRACIAAAS